METSRTIPATSGRRFGAFIIDYLIISSVGLLSSLGIFMIPVLMLGVSPLDIQTQSEHFRNVTDTIDPLFQILIIIIPSAESWLYSAFLESSKWQATIGKRLFGIYVTNNVGQRMSLYQAGLRSGIKILCGVMPCLGIDVLTSVGYIVNFAVILLTEKHQGIHDKVAKTFVVERQVEMAKNIFDQRTYHISVAGGEKILIVTGDNPVLTNVQVGDINLSKSLENFAEEISKVRAKVSEQPPSKERDIAITILNAAEDDAKQGNVESMKERLAMLGSRVGKWVAGFAIEVGANLFAEALIHVAGLK